MLPSSSRASFPDIVPKFIQVTASVEYCQLLFAVIAVTAMPERAFVFGSEYVRPARIDDTVTPAGVASSLIAEKL